jgi:hypothetical protein
MEPNEQDSRYVFATYPVCRACGSANIKATRGAKDVGEGVRERPSKCHDCGQLLTVVLEPSKDYA